MAPYVSLSARSERSFYISLVLAEGGVFGYDGGP
jgi:hypothetical protein